MKSGLSSCQPSVVKGHRAEENQVSRTSSSCRISPEPHPAHFAGGSASTIVVPHCRQWKAGIR